MTSAAADNDVLYKGAWFGLLRELFAAIPATPGDVFVLGHTRFVLAKKFERQKKRGFQGAEFAGAQLGQILAELAIVEPTLDEQLVAADLENAARQLGLALDSGESLLCAIVVLRNLERFVTGDKRAIRALEALSQEHSLLISACGRIVCLEQLVVRMLSTRDARTIRQAICKCSHIDLALANCFSCACPEVDPARCVDGLKSYINALRSEAPTMLTT